MRRKKQAAISRQCAEVKEENPDVEMDPGAACLKDADLTEAKKGARVAVKVIEMRGEEAFGVKHV